MKKIFIIVFAFLALTKPVLANVTESLELNGFKVASENVQFLAKVKITKVEVFQEDDNSEKHVYYADVLSTYKGKPIKSLNYDMYVEAGEDVIFNSEPVYIALCVDESGNFYWPGTGSEFKSSLAIESWLAEHKKEVATISDSIGWCK